MFSLESPLCTAVFHIYGLQHMHDKNSVLTYHFGTFRATLYDSERYGVQEPLLEEEHHSAPPLWYVDLVPSVLNNRNADLYIRNSFCPNRIYQVLIASSGYSSLPVLDVKVTNTAIKSTPR
ncbi:hypothetical protein EDD21DRAFT_352972 [Dissophora ornata]|nr:hypothetical protein EDD21DRAFT_352972 [Dissophora ornata]